MREESEKIVRRNLLYDKKIILSKENVLTIWSFIISNFRLQYCFYIALISSFGNRTANSELYYFIPTGNSILASLFILYTFLTLRKFLVVFCNVSLFHLIYRKILPHFKRKKQQFLSINSSNDCTSENVVRCISHTTTSNKSFKLF